MRAHQLDADGVILQTIIVPNLGFMPGLIDASIGGQPGDRWDGEQVIPAPTPEAPPLPRHLTILAFRNRFTKSEKVRIELAAIDNPSASQEDRERAAVVRVGQADLAAATYVDVDRQDTRDDVHAFEEMGLLDAPGRALAILDDAIQPHERYKA